MSMDKQGVVDAVASALQAALERGQSEFEALQASLSKETKSTAGDKHETGRAMVQLDMEQAGERLARAEAMVAAFRRLNAAEPRTAAGPGAWVVTDSGQFFIGVAAGALTLPDGGRLHAISADAPIAQALRGTTAGTTLEFRGKHWAVVSVH